ncbi:uncharacterized protein [Miscanthus floridulus]|uniref:uncharacterized protein n=1 Tax=Miscanthus floridulus TaxID=154761 RepID=UPI00345B188B
MAPPKSNDTYVDYSYFPTLKSEWTSVNSNRRIAVGLAFMGGFTRRIHRCIVYVPSVPESQSIPLERSHLSPTPKATAHSTLRKSQQPPPPHRFFAATATADSQLAPLPHDCRRRRCPLRRSSPPTSRRGRPFAVGRNLSGWEANRRACSQEEQSELILFEDCGSMREHWQALLDLLNAQNHEPECSNVVSSLSRTDQGTENTDHMSFNQFDVVEGFSDHHYTNTSAGKHFEKLQDRLENQEAETEAEREEHRC